VIFKIIAYGYDRKYNMISSDTLAVHTRPILADILHYNISTPNIIPASPYSTGCSVIESSQRNTHINSSVNRPTDVTLAFYEIDVLIEFDYILYYVSLNNSDGWMKGCLIIGLKKFERHIVTQSLKF